MVSLIDYNSLQSMGIELDNPVRLEESLVCRNGSGSCYSKCTGSFSEPITF